MLKLHASFSKKVPTDEAYSSQSYHAAIEIELPDGLAAAELRERIHQTFALVRDSVEAKLHVGPAGRAHASQPAALAAPATALPVAAHPSRSPARPATAAATTRRRPQARAPRAGQESLSDRQLRFLTDLGIRLDRDLTALNGAALERFGVATLYDLTRQQASTLIEALQAEADGQRRAA